MLVWYIYIHDGIFGVARWCGFSSGVYFERILCDMRLRLRTSPQSTFLERIILKERRAAEKAEESKFDARDSRI